MTRLAGLLAALLLLAAPAFAQTRTIHVDASSGDVANVNAVATIPASNEQLLVTGLEITGAGATAGACVVATLTGPTQTFSYDVCSPTGAAVMMTPIVVQFFAPVPVKFNTAAVLTLPALGTGNLHAAVNLHGYYLPQ